MAGLEDLGLASDEWVNGIGPRSEPVRLNWLPIIMYLMVRGEAGRAMPVAGSVERVSPVATWKLKTGTLPPGTGS